MSIERAVYGEQFEKKHLVEFSDSRRLEIAASLERLADEHFEKRNNLGSGRTSDVWKANVADLEEARCLKTMHTMDISVNSLEREFSFQEEFFNAGVRVPEPIIYVKPDTEAGPTRNGVIAMQEIKGRTLEQIIDDLKLTGEKMPVVEFQRIKKEIADQIEKAHDKRLYHRDLHARNIMIDDSGDVYLIDFGDATRAVGDDEDEIYSQDISRKGKMVRLKFSRDEDILKEFTAAMARDKLVAA